jgi:hypothetical protein
MANRLAMHKSQGSLSLAAAGHSERQIAETLGVSRGAVRRHLGRDGSKRAKAPTGEAPTGSEGSNGTKAPTGPEPGEEARLGRSHADTPCSDGIQGAPSFMESGLHGLTISRQANNFEWQNPAPPLRRARSRRGSK